MPTFDLDIDVEEFVSSCSRRELEKLRNLIEKEKEKNQKSNLNYLDDSFNQDLKKLKNKRHLLTIEEENIIRQISSRIG